MGGSGEGPREEGLFPEVSGGIQEDIDGARHPVGSIRDLAMDYFHDCTVLWEASCLRSQSLAQRDSWVQERNWTHGHIATVPSMGHYYRYKRGDQVSTISGR